MSKLGSIDGALLLDDCICLPSMVFVLVPLAPVADGLEYLQFRLKIDN